MALRGFFENKGRRLPDRNGNGASAPSPPGWLLEQAVAAQEAGQHSLPSLPGSFHPRAPSRSHRAFFVAFDFPLVSSEMKEMRHRTRFLVTET